MIREGDGTLIALDMHQIELERIRVECAAKNFGSAANGH